MYLKQERGLEGKIKRGNGVLCWMRLFTRGNQESGERGEVLEFFARFTEINVEKENQH